MRALKTPLRLLFTFLTLLWLTTASHGASAENLVTCEELPPQPTDGLHVNGVRFYTYGEEGQEEGGGQGAPAVSSTYGTHGPGIGAYVQDPSIITESYAVLGMEFDVPTCNLQFGVALDTQGTLPVGAFVDLYAANEDYIGSVPLTTSSLVRYSEGLVNYCGVPVKYAEVFVNPLADEYAVDNIRFGTFVNRTQGSGEGITSKLDGSRIGAVLSAKATSLGRGTGFFYLLASGKDQGGLRSTRLDTVMLFGNRAVVTGSGVVSGVGTVRFAAEIVDGGTRPGMDRVTVALSRNLEDESFGPAPVISGNFRVW